MELHVEALFTHDASGCLLCVNEPDGAPAPRFFLGRTVDGAVRRFRFDVPETLRNALTAAATDATVHGHAADEPIDSRPFEQLLAPIAPIERTWTGPAFLFPHDLPMPRHTHLVTGANVDVLRPHFAGWIPDVLAGRPLVALRVDGGTVAVCCSVRQTLRAHEAGVETAPEFRGRGFAAPVAAAWARGV